MKTDLQYFNNLSDVELEMQITTEPMSYNESRRIVSNQRVICLYRCDSGRYEAFSYTFKEERS